MTDSEPTEDRDAFQHQKALALERRLQELRRHAEQMKKRSRIGYGLMAVFVCSTVLMVVTLPRRLPPDSPLAVAQVLIPFSLMLAWLGYSLFYFLPQEKRLFGKRRARIVEEYAGQALENELREIAQQAGSRAIGPLIDMMRVTATGVGLSAVYPALISLLSQARDEDANCLTRPQREYLYHTLKPMQSDRYVSAWHDDFRVAILKALEHIGDSQAIPIVEALANSEPNTSSERKVRDAARECQLRLWQHSGQVDAAETLLRAAPPNAAQKDTLLRPASGKSQTVPHELLRPTDSTLPVPPACD